MRVAISGMQLPTNLWVCQKTSQYSHSYQFSEVALPLLPAHASVRHLVAPTGGPFWMALSNSLNDSCSPTLSIPVAPPEHIQLGWDTRHGQAGSMPNRNDHNYATCVVPLQGAGAGSNTEKSLLPQTLVKHLQLTFGPPVALSCSKFAQSTVHPLEPSWHRQSKSTGRHCRGATHPN